MKNVLMFLLCCILASPICSAQSQQQARDKIMELDIDLIEPTMLYLDAYDLKASINVQSLVSVNDPPQGFTTELAISYNALVNAGNGAMANADTFFGAGGSYLDQANSKLTAAWNAYNGGQYYSCIMFCSQGIILVPDAILEYNDAITFYGIAKSKHDEAALYWIGW